jgi:hypothetical protein
MPKFNIGDFAKEKKRLRQEIVMKNRGIKELEDKLSVVASEKQNKTNVQNESEMPKA